LEGDTGKASLTAYLLLPSRAYLDESSIGAETLRIGGY